MLYCKTWMLLNPSDMFAEHTLFTHKIKGCNIIKMNYKRLKMIIITLPIPEKAFGHNHLPIPSRK